MSTFLLNAIRLPRQTCSDLPAGKEVESFEFVCITTDVDKDVSSTIAADEAIHRFHSVNRHSECCADGTRIETPTVIVLLTRTASSHRSRGVRRATPLRARLWAAFLVLLIALPFTAPFSTCDLATLLAAPAPHATEHSLGSSKVDATNVSATVTMEEEDHNACDLEAPLGTTETVTVVVAVDGSLRTYVVVRTSPLPLRL